MEQNPLCPKGDRVEQGDDPSEGVDVGEVAGHPILNKEGGRGCSYHRRVDCRNCASLSHADQITRILQCMVDLVFKHNRQRPSIDQMRTMLSRNFN